MAAGDPQRVWFPETLARLRCEWNSQMSFPALIELRDRLDAMLQQVRSEQHIVSPVLRCLKCGAIGPSTEPHVSVRAPTEAAPPSSSPMAPGGLRTCTAAWEAVFSPESRSSGQCPSLFPHTRFQRRGLGGRLAGIPGTCRGLFQGVRQNDGGGAQAAWAALEIDGVHAGLDGGRRSSHLL